MYVGACLLFMFVCMYIQYLVFVVHLATLVVCLLFMYVAFTLLYLVVCLLFTYIIMFVLHVYSAVHLSSSCCYLFIMVCLLFILLFAFVNTLVHVLQGACSLLHLVQVELVKRTVL